MTRMRLELLQWYALFGGALAWAGQHVAGYFVSDAACGTPRIDSTPWQIVFGVVAGCLVLGAELAALLVFRETSDVEQDAPPPFGRLRFFAQAALAGNVLFFVVIVLNTVGTVYHLPCGES